MLVYLYMSLQSNSFLFVISKSFLKVLIGQTCWNWSFKIVYIFCTILFLDIR